jgi:hypothetical protein
MRNKFILVISIGAFLMVGCQPASKLIVQSASGDIKTSSSGFFYSLPRTVLEVKLEVKHEIYIPGPYCQFAAKFLGIEGVRPERKEDWTIASECINSYSESDPEHILYAGFSAGKPIVPELLTLTKNGLVFSPAATFPSVINQTLENSSLKDNIWFTDLSMDNFYAQKTDTLYKTVLRDSTFVKIPVLKKEEIQKTEELKAKEAATTLLKLRKRRLKLLSGEYNFITEGAALEVTVRELGKMEQEYLSLFIGKQFTEVHFYKNFVVPAINSESQIMWRFTKERGIMPSESKAGLPIILNLHRVKDNNQPELSITPVENSLYFRIPENTTVDLLMDNKKLVESRIPIYQFGKIQIMPVNLHTSSRHRFHL